MTDSASYTEGREPHPRRGAPREARELPDLEDSWRSGLLLPGAGRWRPINLIWLIYSGFFFIGPLQSGSRHDWLVFAGVYACFLALYLLILWVRSRRRRAALFLALAILGAVYFPTNPNAGGGMLCYVAAFVAFSTSSLTIAIATIVGSALALMTEGVLLHLSPWAWGIMSFICVAVGTGNLISALRSGASKRLVLAQEQMQHLAKVAERERIARDLHDVLGHTLSVVVLKSELAGKLIDSADRERARHEIGEVEQIARQALSDVREAIRGYRAEGIATEIARARRTLDAAGVRLEWEAQSVRLAPAHESVVSLVLREAVTNILRHAGATSCRLELAADGRGTHLTVHDNGRGAREYTGNGLRGMRERVEALGGRVEIDSRQGTRLTIEIPAGAAV